MCVKVAKRAKNYYLCDTKLSFLIFKVNTFRVVFQLRGSRSDTRAFIFVNILKFFEKSFGSPITCCIFEVSKGNNQLKIRIMEIIDYVKRGSKEDKGAIIINVYGNEKEYIAVTISTSKTYKTLKGAEKMMAFFRI